MPTESSRTRSVRRITAPGDTGTYVDLKVIDDITFTEQEPPYQEWVLAFKNNPTDAARTVHVVEVGDDKLKVERIDTLNTTETTGIAQEAIWSFLNNDSPPVHLETHETTIYASDGNGNITDTGTWIKVQRIDKIEFTDSADEVPGQEYVWSLDNPDKQDSQDDYKNLTAPITSWDNSSINPPWRLDPFQTIVDAAFSTYKLFIEICNTNSARDDIFDVFVNGTMVIKCDFTPDDEKTSFIIKASKSDSFPEPIGIVRGTKEYDSFTKSPFKLDVNTIEFRNIGLNNNGNFFRMETHVFNADGEEVLIDNQEMSGFNGESFTKIVDLSSLKSN